VINCTNNQFIPIKIPFTPIFEYFCSLLYKIDFEHISGLTIMDGFFFSIFPYDIENKLYLFKHVKYEIL